MPSTPASRRGVVLTTDSRYWLPLLLLLLTPVAFHFSLVTGAAQIGAAEVYRGLVGFLCVWIPIDEAAATASLNETIVRDIRAPRALLAWLIGAALGVTGAITQALFRNSLADPSIIGVTSGASLGASLAIVFTTGAGIVGGLPVLLPGAFIGGIVAVLLVYRLATGGRSESSLPMDVRTSVLTMLLLGIAITALAGAANSLLGYFVDNELLRRMSLWSMGGLDAADAQRVVIATCILLPAMFYFLLYHRQLDAFLLGESEAAHLGLDVERLKRNLIAVVAIAVAAAVSLAGVIGFIGLVVPHIVRLIAGPRHNLLLPCACLGGGLLLVLADTLARVVAAPADVPVGALTALLGAPLFVSLVYRRTGITGAGGEAR